MTDDTLQEPTDDEVRAARTIAAQRMTTATTGRSATADQLAAHREVARAYTDLANILLLAVPEGRRRAVALTQLEDSLMWAGKALFNPGE